MSDYGYEDTHQNNQPEYSRVRKPSDRKKAIDTHEILKKELYLQTGMNISPGGIIPTGAGSDTESFLGTKEKYGLVDRFFYLDSNDRSGSSDIANGIYAFDIQQLNQLKPLDNVIEMEIGDFFIPDIVTGPDFPAYFFFKRLVISIQEMESQSVFAESGTFRFHFEVGLQNAGISLETKNIGFNKFIFTRPYRDLATATMRFSTHSYPSFKQVKFQQDIFDFVAVPGVAGGVFGGATITTAVPHGLTVGDDVSVYITGFFSGDATIDNNINDEDGHLLRVINANTLEFRAAGVVGFDFLGLVPATPGQLLIAFRRLAFTIRFRSLTPNITNRIIPV